MESDYEVIILEKYPKGGQQSGGIPVGVKVKHIPTGIVVCCDCERSQYQNRELAMRMIQRGLEILDL